MSMTYRPYNVHPPPPYQIFKIGGLIGPKFLEGIAGKDEGDLFQGGGIFIDK